MRIPRVKICCIQSAQEARLAIAAGASALGLVSAMPSGPGPIDEALIAEIVRTVPPPVATFLLTCLQDVASIASQLRRTECNTIQLCDELLEGTYDDLRAECPGVKIVQVIHVQSERSVREAVAVAPQVDALLLDSGRPGAATKELGGTGRTHDWSLSRQIRDAARAPLFLAGGLRADNVADAITQVDPYGVDLCSGVRSNGRLDPIKLNAFFAALPGSRG